MTGSSYSIDGGWTAIWCYCLIISDKLIKIKIISSNLLFFLIQCEVYLLSVLFCQELLKFPLQHYLYVSFFEKKVVLRLSQKPCQHYLHFWRKFKRKENIHCPSSTFQLFKPEFISFLEWKLLIFSLIKMSSNKHKDSVSRSMFSRFRYPWVKTEKRLLAEWYYFYLMIL